MAILILLALSGCDTTPPGETYYRAEEMGLLAEIWHDRGDGARAGELLVDCLQKLVTDVQQSKYNSDRELLSERFQQHRSTYLRLFPSSENDLAKAGIPVEPL
jgi:hypothetical protein